MRAVPAIMIDGPLAAGLCRTWPRGSPMTRGGLGQPLQGVCGQRVSRLAMHSYPERLIFRVEMVRPAFTHFGALDEVAARQLGAD